MLHVITGGSGSGKSAYAEQQVLQAGAGRRIYIATMIPYGEEGKQRVERHRHLRAQKNFETIECYQNLAELTVPKDSIILLECMSNLVANEVFEAGGAGRAAADAVCDGVRHLMEQAAALFIVTNEIFSDGIRYEKETIDYLRQLGEVNSRLSLMADRVTEVVYGIPVQVKSNLI
jgi:adenosylcobinamide kinase/adenosylcobinamide-phosphate guanylyltransferase